MDHPIVSEALSATSFVFSYALTSVLPYDFDIHCDVVKALVVFSGSYRATKKADISVLLTGIYFLLKTLMPSRARMFPDAGPKSAPDDARNPVTSTKSVGRQGARVNDR
eukprot:jgi/Mesvir1/12722/Mv22471-RA.1